MRTEGAYENNLMIESYESIYIPKKPLWNPKYFLVLSIIFSYIPVSFFFIMNFHRMKEVKKRNVAIALTSLAIIAQFIGLFYIEGESISRIYAIVIVSLMALYYRNNQLKMYNKLIENGAKKANLFWPIIISILFLIATIFAIIKVQEMEDRLSLKIYNKFDDVIYYCNVTSEEVEALGNYFEMIQIFAEDNDEWEIVFIKTNESYVIRLFYLEESLENPELISDLEWLREDIESKLQLDREGLKLHICNGDLDILRIIE